MRGGGGRLSRMSERKSGVKEEEGERDPDSEGETFQRKPGETAMDLLMSRKASTGKKRQGRTMSEKKVRKNAGEGGLKRRKCPESVKGMPG